METEVSEKLRRNIIHSIRHEEIRRVRIAFAFSLASMGASTLGIVVSIRYAMLALAQSGFLSFISLAFSDADILAAYWRGFAFSLIETLPFLAMTFALVALVAFLFSLRMLATNVRGGFSPSLT